MTNPPEFGWPVREAGCIKLRDNYNIFDLKQLERGVESTSYARGTAINCITDYELDSDTTAHPDDCGADANSLFMYKVCQSEWQFPHRIFSLDPAGVQSMTREQEQESTAFWGMQNADDGGRVYLKKTFHRPTWDVVLNGDWDETDKDSKKYSGLYFHYSAEQNGTAEAECTTSGPNNIKFEVTCKSEFAEGEDKFAPIVWARGAASTDCDIVYETENYAGCYVDASSYFRWVTGFTAFFMIAIGLFMIFVGAKFIVWVLGIIVFFVVQCMVFAISYSYGFVDPVTLFRTQEGGVSGTSGTIAILVLIISCLLGVIAAWYLTQFVSKLFLVILAF
jgi:hypothetical protein